MKPISIYPADFPDASPVFKAKFDSFLNLCEFSEEIRLGMLFFMGAITPSIAMHKSSGNITPILLSFFSIYSKGKGKIEEFKSLNVSIFSSLIYNANQTISILTKENPGLDQQLDNIAVAHPSVWKMKSDSTFLSSFKSEPFNLKTRTNLFDQLFTATGSHLKRAGLDNERAFEAGVAYLLQMNSIDLKGTEFMLLRLFKALPYLYYALLNLPYTFIFRPEIFANNDLFSLILGFYYYRNDEDLKPLSKIIHNYHRYIFYKNKWAQYNYNWRFHESDKWGSARAVFDIAIDILEFKQEHYSEITDKFDEVEFFILKGQVIHRAALLHFVLDLIQSKYGLDGKHEFLSDYKVCWKNHWEHKGAYLQFLALLYFHTAIHALIVKEIK